MLRANLVGAVAIALAAATALSQDQSVYAPPAPTTIEEGINEGGLRFDFDLAYLTDYVYRGVNYTEVTDPISDEDGNNNLNLYLDARMTFDLGPRMPHPFVSLAANIYESDPQSRFQEFRPAIGADLTLQPVTFTAGVRSAIYPEREELDTAEVFFTAALDDSRLLGMEQPLLSPYVLIAYDYDLNDGWYVETGIRHDFAVDRFKLVLTPIARVAYTNGWQQQFVFMVEEGDGWQHWDVGMLARVELNSLLNFSRRWGEWYLRGQVFHTEHLAGGTVGHHVTWGGVGLGFIY